MGPELIGRLRIPGYGADEVGFMEETMLASKPQFIGEWGTNRGSSARIFYELSQLHKITCEIHTVDLPVSIASIDRDHCGEHQGDFIHELPVHQHLGDGVTEVLIAWIGTRKRALFFIDGEHLKENVFREIVWIHRCAPKAVMLLHDTKDGPGAAVCDYTTRFPDQYHREDLSSQAGMVRLTPK